MSFGVSAYAQKTEEQKAKIRKGTDVKRLLELSAEYTAKYEAKRAEALKQAKIYNWPEKISDDKGVSLLVDVVDGNPLYLTTDNVGSALTSRTNSLQPGGDLGLNLTGSIMVVGMWDGDYPRATHDDFVGRLAVNDGTPVPNHYHPTHVLGTMIGAGVSTPGAKGMATDAFALVYSYDNDYAEMAQQAAVEALLLSNHSYGYNFDLIPASWRGEYREEAMQVDEVTFGAKYYTPCFSAGNDNSNSSNYDILTDRTMAKNAIVVGAVNQVSSYTGPSSVTLAGFSSFGPTNDNRIKPDIVTKGSNVLSSWNTSDTASSSISGTSMSCPGVTGSLLLVQEHFYNQNDGNFMKSATLRGLVAHAADECGSADGPDARFGWGLLNTKRMAQIISGAGDTSVIQELTLLPGEEFTFSVLAAGNEPLIATLAWTDPAKFVGANQGLGNTKALINDLDIRVTRNDNTYMPWRLGSSPTAAAVKGDNTVDNIEKVEIASPDVEWYTVTVSHKGTTLQNPGTGAVPSQEFSVIVSGITDNIGNAAEYRADLFNVWPNPATDVINVSVTDVSLQDNASLSVYDIQGRQVRNAALTTNESSVDVKGLSSGVYFVKIVNGTQQQVKKVAIK